MSKKLEDKLKKIIIFLFDISDHDYNHELGINDLKKWDSLGHINLMLEINKKFKVHIDPDFYGSLTNIKRIIKYLKIINE